MENEVFAERRAKLATLLGWTSDTNTEDRLFDLAEIVVRTCPNIIVREVGKRCPKCRGRTGGYVNDEWVECSCNV